jgi:hypothetical protein
MNTQDLVFELSQSDERIVRSYECTRLRKLFSPETLGHLTITNRRIVFHSTGASLTGKSVLISEMPVEDVAGISVYLGNTINWLLYVAFAIGLFLLSSVVDAILPAFFTSWPFAVLLMLPHAVFWLFSSKWLSEDVKKQVGASLQNMLQDRAQNVDVDRFRPAARVLFLIGLAVFVWAIARAMIETTGGGIVVAIGLLGLAYFGLFMTIFGRQPVFSLLIGSKSMQGSGIFIPGSAFRLSFLWDRTAVESLAGSPAVDAPAVARELGALLTDIRQLGEFGLQKWQA